VADIGCDHGRLSAYLLLSGRCETVIASDVSPTARARAHALFTRFSLWNRATLSDRDGLEALTRPVDAVVVAGMGGKTVARILAQPVNLGGAALILSPQTDLPLARDAVYARGYHMSGEYAVRSGGRFYLVMDAAPGAGQMTPAQRLLGVNLRDGSPGAARDYLLWQRRVADAWQGEIGETYRKLLEEALRDAPYDGSGGT
jgi:tRNA (adenine22-N1)-methyltransferase